MMASSSWQLWLFPPLYQFSLVSRWLLYLGNVFYWPHYLTTSLSTFLHPLNASLLPVLIMEWRVDTLLGNMKLFVIFLFPTLLLALLFPWALKMAPQSDKMVLVTWHVLHCTTRLSFCHPFFVILLSLGKFIVWGFFSEFGIYLTA